MSALKAPPKLSYEEFLAWCDEDSWAEWVDGEVVMVSPASNRHQDIVGFLVTVLGIYVQARDLGTVLTAPFQMRLAELRRGREPDLLFIVTNDLGVLDIEVIRGVMQARWRIEQYHRELQQVSGIELCQARKGRSQRNHIWCAIRVWLALWRGLNRRGKACMRSSKDCWTRIYAAN